MKLSLPESLESFAKEQVSKRGYTPISEYVRDLIRTDQGRQDLRQLLIEGAASKTTAAADEQYFRDLRTRATIG